MLFILLALAYLAACVLLAAARDSRALYLTVAGISVAAVAGYAWSRSFGLPQLADDVGKWTEPLGIVAITFETLAALRRPVRRVGNGLRMDVVSLLPAGMIVADMVPDNPGTWLFHCHVNDHIKAGMLTRYRVTG